MPTKENEMPKNRSYNYQHFDPKDYDFSHFEGPKAGERFIDFQATTLEGKIVSLSDYLNKPIVLETGSITCPMYANTKDPMWLLQENYPDVHFLLLYVREAHPGTKTNAVTTLDEKIENAASTHGLYHEKREILVDTLDGHAHQLYGGMPNMTYVIGTDGMVKFRANWTNIDALKKVLLTVHDSSIEKQDYFEATKPPPYTAVRTLLIGGFGALIEFLVGLPQLIRQHKEAKSKRDS